MSLHPSPQHPVLKHPQRQTPSLKTHTKQQVKITLLYLSIFTFLNSYADFFVTFPSPSHDLGFGGFP
jgi:hypothetical protein